MNSLEILGNSRIPWSILILWIHGHWYSCVHKNMRAQTCVGCPNNILLIEMLKKINCFKSVKLTKKYFGLVHF